MTRKCKMCAGSYPVEQFAPSGAGRWRNFCKSCWAQQKSTYDRLRYSAQKERIDAVRSRWRQANRSRDTANKAAYRVRRIRQQTPLTPEQHAEIAAIYERAKQLTEITGIKHEVDHIYPITHPTSCGLHVPANLQVLPKSLNAKKSNNLTLDMLAPPAVSLQHVDET